MILALCAAAAAAAAAPRTCGPAPAAMYDTCYAYFDSRVLVSMDFVAAEGGGVEFRLQLMACIGRGWVGFGVGDPATSSMTSSAIVVGFSTSDGVRDIPCVQAIRTTPTSTGGMPQVPGGLQLLGSDVTKTDGWLNVTATMNRTLDCTFFRGGGGLDLCDLGAQNYPLKVLLAYHELSHDVSDPRCLPAPELQLTGHAANEAMLFTNRSEVGWFPWTRNGTGNCVAPTRPPSSQPPTPPPPPDKGPKTALIVGVVLSFAGVLFLAVTLYIWYVKCRRHGVLRRHRMRRLDGGDSSD
eukprot:TRINITY_DN1914_c0_g1_i1.p1 TRINITY_DN1914_c0_g1~~TRINITY_DN1914_c0_g1_i1.p1  ORF type:complete len:296 (+),score=61.56 TRINITY_DN1914_c0_g1_i1:58-945(+)